MQVDYYRIHQILIKILNNFNLYMIYFIPIAIYLISCFMFYWIGRFEVHRLIKRSPGVYIKKFNDKHIKQNKYYRGEVLRLENENNYLRTELIRARVGEIKSLRRTS